MTRVWLVQSLALIRLEVKKTFFAKRGLWIYLLAFMPLALFVAHAIVLGHQNKVRERIASESARPLTYQDLTSVTREMSREEITQRLGKPPISYAWDERREDTPGSSRLVICESYRYSDGANDLYIRLEDGKVVGTTLGQHESLGENTVVFAGVFQFFYLRLAIFFGCLGIFMNLFRGEILDKSLHFYFLAPIRREVLMVGKFLAGLLATCVIFVTSEVLQIIVFTGQFTPNVRDLYLYQNHGLTQAAAYLGVTALACL